MSYLFEVGDTTRHGAWETKGVVLEVHDDHYLVEIEGYQTQQSMIRHATLDMYMAPWDLPAFRRRQASRDDLLPID